MHAAADDMQGRAQARCRVVAVQRPCTHIADRDHVWHARRHALQVVQEAVPDLRLAVSIRQVAHVRDQLRGAAARVRLLHQPQQRAAGARRLGARVAAVTHVAKRDKREGRVRPQARRRGEGVGAAGAGDSILVGCAGDLRAARGRAVVRGAAGSAQARGWRHRAAGERRSVQRRAAAAAAERMRARARAVVRAQRRACPHQAPQHRSVQVGHESV